MAAQVLTQDGLTSVLMNTPLPVIVHQDGKVVFANPAAYELKGLSPGAYGSGIGMDVYQFYTPEEREKAQANAAAILAGGKRVDNMRRRVVGRDGRAWVHIGSATPIEWNGRPALEVSFVLIPDPDVGERAEALARLTQRQRDIAMLVARGYTTLNVAASLMLSDMTVRTHVRNIFRKLGVHSRVELANLVGERW